MDVSNKQWELIKITKKESNIEDIKTVVIVVLVITLAITIPRLTIQIKENQRLDSEINTLKDVLENSQKEKIKLNDLWTEMYDKKKVPDSIKFVPIKLDVGERDWFSDIDLIDKDCENFLGITIQKEPFSEIFIEKYDEEFTISNKDYSDDVEFNLICGEEKKDSPLEITIPEEQCPGETKPEPIYKEKENCLEWSENYYRCLKYGEPIRYIDRYQCA